MLAATLLCLVVGVSDGDTLTARCGQPGEYQQVKVRIGGIDAPESRQPYGARAKQALSDLTFQKQAELPSDKLTAIASVILHASDERATCVRSHLPGATYIDCT